MSEMPRIPMAAFGLLLVLAAGRPAAAAVAAEGYCTEGAVNTITSNYSGGATEVAERCEICLHVRVQDAGAPDGWEQAGVVCNIWSDAQAHDVMFRIGQCGLIVPQFEGVGAFYNAAVPIRVEAVRKPPCT